MFEDLEIAIRRIAQQEAEALMREISKENIDEIIELLIPKVDEMIERRFRQWLSSIGDLLVTRYEEKEKEEEEKTEETEQETKDPSVGRADESEG